MGGKAIEGSRRIKKEEYDEITHDIKKLLETLFDEVYFPKNVREKLDHGDIDAFVGGIKNKEITMNDIEKETENAKTLMAKITVLFKGKNFQHTKGHSTYNFGYYHKEDVEPIQIDVNISNKPKLYSQVSSYGTLNRYISNIATHVINVTYYRDGLWFKINEDDKLLLTDNFEDMLNFVGFNYDSWEKGFDTYHDLLKFIIKSKYYNNNIFLDQKMINKHKELRDSQRKLDILFIKYLDGQKLDVLFKKYLIKIIKQIRPNPLKHFNKEQDYKNIIKCKEKYDRAFTFFLSDKKIQLNKKQITDFKSRFEKYIEMNQQKIFINWCVESNIDIMISDIFIFYDNIYQHDLVGGMNNNLFYYTHRNL